MKLLRQLVLVACTCLSSLASAFTILPADGLWSIVAEQNLSVGRAFNLEMSDTLLVTTMYAYNAQGAPTFYVGTAPLSASNTATMNLSEPQGGTCFACTPTSGRLLSSPGSATSKTGFARPSTSSARPSSSGGVAATRSADFARARGRNPSAKPLKRRALAHVSEN